jgi:isoleucyl-tRNA synthetase
MGVQTADERERRAVERFADQICEELNIKKVTLHDPANGPLLRSEVKPNLKTLGPKFGPKIKEVVSALAAADARKTAEEVQAGRPVELSSSNGPLVLEPGDVVLQVKPPEGWAGLADRGTQVAIDVRITADLAGEGKAREVVRHVQELRKKSGLEMENRIVLYLETPSASLAQAIQAHRSYICNETLAVELSPHRLDGDVHRANVKIDGDPLLIELRKV